MSKGVDIVQAANLMKLYVSADKPVLLRANHGIGKSTIVYDLAKELNLPVVERRLSQMSEGDMTGIPRHRTIKYNNQEYEVTKFAPTDWIMECVMHPRILFLDEIDRAILELRQAAFQLLDSKSFNGLKLHPGTRVIAAINGGPNSNDSYQVSNLDPAELSRYSVIDILLDVPIWLKWAKRNQLHNSIIKYISEDNSKLAHNGVFNPDVVYPCPRSWHRLSDVLFKYEELNDEKSNVLNISQSFVGYDIASAFYKYYIKEYKVYNIIKMFNGEYDISKMKANDKAAICSLEHITQNIFSIISKDSDDNIKNMINFSKSLDKEMLILFISNMFFASSYLMNNSNYIDFPLIKMLSENNFKQYFSDKMNITSLLENI